MSEPEVGGYWGRGRYRKRIREVLRLSNGWYLIKTDDSKSANDFKVKTIFSLEPVRSLTPKHAHFAIDFYGKVCADSARARRVLEAVGAMWGGSDVRSVLERYDTATSGLPGYPLEYILYALRWILEQEELNFSGRPEKRQRELELICRRVNFEPPADRPGGLLAVALLCDIMGGTHPVEALLKANLDIQPRRR